MKNVMTLSILSMLILLFSSCSDDSSETVNAETIKLTCKIETPQNEYILNEDETVDIKITADSENADEFSIRYILNDKVIKEKSEPPFDITLSYDDLSLDENNFKISAVYDNRIFDNDSIIISKKAYVGSGCSIVSPLQNDMFYDGDTLNIKISTKDEAKFIKNVEYFINEELINTETEAPYSFSTSEINTSFFNNGAYELTAKINYNNGSSKLSDPVSVWFMDYLTITGIVSNIIDEVSIETIQDINFTINNEPVIINSNKEIIFDKARIGNNLLKSNSDLIKPFEEEINITGDNLTFSITVESEVGDYYPLEVGNWWKYDYYKNEFKLTPHLEEAITNKQKIKITDKEVDGDIITYTFTKEITDHVKIFYNENISGMDTTYYEDSVETGQIIENISNNTTEGKFFEKDESEVFRRYCQALFHGNETNFSDGHFLQKLTLKRDIGLKDYHYKNTGSSTYSMEEKAELIENNIE